MSKDVHMWKIIRARIKWDCRVECIGGKLVKGINIPLSAFGIRASGGASPSQSGDKLFECDLRGPQYMTNVQHNV